MANEASAALSDAYGHLMHGDDAGASAKVVWVVHPTNVPIDIHSGIADSNNAAGAGAGEQLVGVGGGGMGNNGNGASSTQKMQQQQQQQSTKNSEIVGVGGASNASVASPGRNSSPYLFTQKFGERDTYLVCTYLPHNLIFHYSLLSATSLFATTLQISLQPL